MSDYDDLRRRVEALRDGDKARRDWGLWGALTDILDACPPTAPLPDGIEMHATALAADALRLVQTGEWTAHWNSGEEVSDDDLASDAEHYPRYRFLMRPLVPPATVTVELPVDAARYAAEQWIGSAPQTVTIRDACRKALDQDGDT